MSYPEYLRVVLNEVNGSSCGTLNHRYKRDAGSDPPTWSSIPGGGDFLYGACAGMTDASGQMESFELMIRYFNYGTPCHGIHTFHRSPASPDDPTGNYCAYSNEQINCDLAKASVYNDD